MKVKKIIELLRKYKTYIYLFFIIIIAFYFRTFNTNWDSNYYFHPDERAIVMFASPLNLPSSLKEFFSIESPLNPHFFAYGNMPLYLLRGIGEIFSYINPVFKEYGGLHIIGRFINAIFDTGTVFIIFLVAKNVFSKRAGLFASLLYATSVFPIQNSHFFTVDTLLTFFIALTILAFVYFIKSQKLLNIIGVGIFFGLALSTKISAGIIIIPLVLGGLLVSFKNKKFLPKKYLIFITTLFITFVIVFSLTQPYAFIDYVTFKEHNQLQSQMSNNAYLFPYTLQYFDKTPYIYEIKNIFLWGLGPISATLCILGLLFSIINLRSNKILHKRGTLFLLICFFCYFALFGKFSVGWMRYMLPIYPILCIFGGYFISEIVISKIPKRYIKNYYFRKFSILFVLLMLVVYPLSFLSIYLKPNTRIQASEWINSNIPPGSTVAVEHWDDALPVMNGSNFTQLQLPLYEPESISKWEGIDQTLKNSDYIFIASNRLYKPLMRMTNCSALPSGRCYTRTSKYYSDLFNERLGYKKVAEFSNYPTVPFLNIKLVDDNADESFTVYDHPKIYIFKKD